MINYYTWLGIPDFSDAKTIRNEYRRLMMKHHPDRKNEESGTQATQAINEAYTFLRDPGKKQDLDGWLIAEGEREAVVDNVNLSESVDEEKDQTGASLGNWYWWLWIVLIALYVAEIKWGLIHKLTSGN